MVNRGQLKPRIERLLRDLSQELELSPNILHPPPSTHERPDVFMELEGVRSKPIRLAVEVCGNPRHAPVQQAADRIKRIAHKLGAIPIVAAPRLGSGLRSWLRKNDVGYLDLHGHVFLRGHGLLVEREELKTEVDLPWNSESGSPFADRSSRILRYLIPECPDELRIRDLADRLEVSPALVSRVVRRLKNDGYLTTDDNGRYLIQSPELILREWGEYYRRRAKRQHQLRFYLHARDVPSMIRLLRKRLEPAKTFSWGLSYHAGASLIAPFAIFSEVHVLLSASEWEREANKFASVAGAQASQQNTNLIVVEPYYSHSWDFDLRSVKGVPVVSNIQLYLDLANHPRRGTEQAGRILEKILKTVNRR